MVEIAPLKKLFLSVEERNELARAIDTIKLYRNLTEQSVLLIKFDRYDIEVLSVTNEEDNGGSLVWLSFVERQIIDVYRASIEKRAVDGDSPYSSESISTDDGVINRSFFKEGLYGSESSDKMSQTPEELREVLEEILHTQTITAEANAEADKIEEENNRLIIEILDDLVPNSPHKDALRKILTHS